MRIIDADKLIDIIDEWLDVVGEAWVRKHTSYYGELLGCIEETPTVDAVEIVRCEDCKHYDITTEARCVHQFGLMFPTKDDYCSHGKRRDDV